jgi:hypothetical protein
LGQPFFTIMSDIAARRPGLMSHRAFKSQNSF